MLSVFEYEKKIDENFFVFKFHEIERYFLLKLLPFRLWQLENYEPEKTDIDISKFSDDIVIDTGNLTPLFILTNKCNLACSYCYADEGSYGCSGAFMSDEVIEQTFDGLLSVYRNHLAKVKPPSFQVNAVCFGGEPLLHIEGLKSVLEKQKKISGILTEEFPNTKITYKQHINTNGYQISEKAKKHLIDNKESIELVLSFDGLNHDKHRLSKLGEPSAKEVLDNINFYSSEGIDVSVTCCLQPDELLDFKNNIEYLISVISKNVSINFSFLRGSLHFRNISSSNKEYLYDNQAVIYVANIIADYIKKGYNIYNKKFSQLQERAFLYRCPAIGKKEICVMPNGSVYPCHNFVASTYTYGTVGDSSTFSLKNAIFDSFLEERKIYDTPGCTDCCMKSICLSSFDCPSHSLFDLGDIHQNDAVVCDFGRIVQKELLLNSIKDLY